MSETLYYCPCCGCFWRHDTIDENVDLDDVVFWATWEKEESDMSQIWFEPINKNSNGTDIYRVCAKCGSPLRAFPFYVINEMVMSKERPLGVSWKGYYLCATCHKTQEFTVQKEMV